MVIDSWYGIFLAECDDYDAVWSDMDCIYRGNLYRNKKPVGDWSSEIFEEFEKRWREEHPYEKDREQY